MSVTNININEVTYDLKIYINIVTDLYDMR